MQEIKKLIDGFGRFRARYFVKEQDTFRQLVDQGQAPKVLIVACCDSRVDPAIITDCDPGDLFVVRNVANLVPPCEEGGHYHGTSAALEFGVCSLNVRHVIVLGHARCGGIRALMNGISQEEDRDGFIGNWMNIAADARTRVLAELPEASPEARACACEQAAIQGSLDNLMTFPSIRERVEQGKLQLHGWYFDLEEGRLLGLDPGTQRFEPLA